MEDNISFTEYQPGHLHLPLNINRLAEETFEQNDFLEVERFETKPMKSCPSEGVARKRDLKFRYESIAASLLEEDVPDENAARNFLGLLAYRMDEYEIAVSHFEAVLEVDADNVNAIQNIAETYARLNQSEASEKENIKVQRLLGKIDKSVSENLINQRIACSLSEQAYAHAHDIGLLYYEEKKRRLDSAITLYDRAFGIGASAVSLEERRRWYFAMATIFVRLDTLMIWSRDPGKQRLTGFNRAINLLKEVSKSEQLYHKALAWAYLGILLQRQSTFDTTPMAIHDCGFTGLEPLDSYSKAIQLAEKEPSVLNRLAKVFLLLGKHELALGTASMAVDIGCDDVSILSAYHNRARVNTAIYMKGLNLCKMNSNTMPDRSLLEKAKEDLDAVVSSLPGLRAYMDIGQGEETNALECFKKSLELDREGSKNPQAFRYILETYISLYSHGGAHKREAIINEVDRWVRYAVDKCDNDVILSELKAISRSYTHEFLELCKGAIGAGKLSLPKSYFSAFPSSIREENTDTESVS